MPAKQKVKHITPAEMVKEIKKNGTLVLDNKGKPIRFESDNYENGQYTKEVLDLKKKK
jgi:hypothetical protein